MEFLFENSRCFIVYKPPGLHTASRDRSDSLAELLIKKNPALAAVGTPGRDAGLVQRLDFETSGILLGAKTQEDWNKFRGLVKSGGLSKKYLILVEGLLNERFQAEAFIGSPYRRGRKVRVEKKGGARLLPAVTFFTPVALCPDSAATIVLATAPLARRHQIRAMAASNGWPLVGDKLYGALQSTPSETPAFWLHAATLDFIDPWSSRRHQFISPWPDYWLHYLSRLGIDPAEIFAQVLHQ